LRWRYAWRNTYGPSFASNWDRRGPSAPGRFEYIRPSRRDRRPHPSMCTTTAAVMCGAATINSRSGVGQLNRIRAPRSCVVSCRRPGLAVCTRPRRYRALLVTVAGASRIRPAYAEHGLHPPAPLPLADSSVYGCKPSRAKRTQSVVRTPLITWSRPSHVPEIGSSPAYQQVPSSPNNAAWSGQPDSQQDRPRSGATCSRWQPTA
jgi:hypothetical protein